MPLRETAVVIGAGFAGLISAQMLKKHFRKVLVIEQSPSPDTRYTTQIGVAPQTDHAHHLLFEGKRLIDHYFPNYYNDLLRLGGKSLDFGSDFRFFQYGCWREKRCLGAQMYLAERPVLERALLTELQRHESIQFVWNQRVDPNSLGGLRDIEPEKASSISTNSNAELVLDCTGRWDATRTITTTAKIVVWYTTYFLDVSHLSSVDWTVLIGYNRRPHQRIACYVGFTPRGHSQLQFTVMAYGYRPPADREAMITHLRSFGPEPIFAEILERGRTKLKGKQLFFEDMFIDHAPPPIGLIRVGDSASSLDPVTGVGITKAAKEVELLDNLLLNLPEVDDICRQYHRQSNTLRKRAWDLIREQNERFDSTSLINRVRHIYIDCILKASQGDGYIFKRFLDVRNLRRPMSHLYGPIIMARTLFACTRTLISHQLQAPSPQVPNFQDAPDGPNTKRPPTRAKASVGD